MLLDCPALLHDSHGVVKHCSTSLSCLQAQRYQMLQTRAGFQEQQMQVQKQALQLHQSGHPTPESGPSSGVGQLLPIITLRQILLPACHQRLRQQPLKQIIPATHSLELNGSTHHLSRAQAITKSIQRYQNCNSNRTFGTNTDLASEGAAAFVWHCLSFP